MSYKIAIIGGGSSIFSPQLISLFIQSKLLSGSTVCLMDINAQRVELMLSLGKQLIGKTGANLEIESTTDRIQALTEADFVITSISVGGFDAWEKDIEIPARYGIFVPFGDSVGPGGMMRAFRHVLPMVQLCKDLERVSPNAWVFNYTNPATALSAAMIKESSIRIVGLCTNTVSLTNEKFMASWVGANPDELVLPPTAGGINHCAAILRWLYKDGRDAFPQIRERTRHPLIQWGLDTYGILPYVWPHWIEFYPSMCNLESEYKGRAQGLTLSYGIPIKDMKTELTRVQRWEELVGKWSRGEGEVELEAIPKTEPVQVVEIMEAIIEDRKEVHVVNVPNHGSIDNLPDNAVVEVSSLVSGQGVQPLYVGKLPKAIAAFLRLYLEIGELTVEAAMAGDRRLALQAFELDPFISSRLTLSETNSLLNDLLSAHASHLPQFN